MNFKVRIIFIHTKWNVLIQNIKRRIYQFSKVFIILLPCMLKYLNSKLFFYSLCRSWRRDCQEWKGRKQNQNFHVLEWPVEA